MAPKFADNIILTKTERLMMSNRPPDPKNARNKNVLVVGGSGSGKTRFWLKPNLLQCHSSYVVTDPKGSIVVECGNALLKKGYKLKILNTINFSKSIRSLSAYIRKMALDGYCLNLDLPQLRRMAYLLQMCSNNLNQYAKAANETGRVYAADMEDLRQRLDELIEIGRQILSRLAEL